VVVVETVPAAEMIAATAAIEAEVVPAAVTAVPVDLVVPIFALASRSEASDGCP
jgi:hypothetical protein